MERNQRVRVKEHAPHHAGEVGYFQFLGRGPSEGVVVLSETPVCPGGNSMTLFAVDASDLLPTKN